MATRLDAEAAIRRWHDLSLFQKELAARAGVKETTVSHIAHEPGWTASEKVYGRICRVVQAEVASRIISIPMEVLALCHSDGIALDKATSVAIVSSIRATLAQLSAEGSVSLPKGIKGALVRLGEKGFGMFLVVVSANNSNEERRAVAHELEHLRLEILSGTQNDFKTPRSSF